MIETMRRSPRSRAVLFGLLSFAACTDDAVSAPDAVPSLGGSAGSSGAGGRGGAGGTPVATKGGAAGASAGGAAGDQAGLSGQGGKGGSGGAASGGSGGKLPAGGAGGSVVPTAGTAGKGGGVSGVVPTGTCAVEFTTRRAATALAVAGDWNGFAKDSALELVKGTDGVARGVLALPPGLHAYKLLADGQYELNPDEGRRKYVAGVENSAILVRDCDKASLRTLTSAPTAGGAFDATLAYSAPTHGPGSGAGAAAPKGTLASADGVRPLSGSELAVDAQGRVVIKLAGLTKGKHTVRVVPVAEGGAEGEALRLPFWVEEEAFQWKDALIYMIVTDRFRNGDLQNDAPPVGAEPRGEFQGGDLEGVRQAIADGSLDKLGVRALWMTPFQTNPKNAYPASDPAFKVTGYHGYWPVKAREVDPRLGGETALRALVAEAHRHGIRILQDFVINHVHEDHEYVLEHADWFRQGCVCGTNNCDWTEHALDCKFTPYLPDVDHTNPAANQAFVDDAVWWMDTFDLDGLRIDAVKHVEEVATRNVSAAVRDAFDAGNAKPFLMGETAMGFSDCPDPCNDTNYGTIARYLGPQGLDGQFDFVLYHGVSYATFAYGDRGMLHADYWTKHGLEKWPKDAVMTPYLGSHDTARFASLADYRGQDQSHGRGVPGNQWNDPAGAPSDDEPYARTRLAMAWLLGLPGAPLLYYGDELADWGGSDPNNRRMMRPEAELGAREKETLAFVRKLGTTRQEVEALRRGEYVSLAGTTEDTLVFGRNLAGGKSAIVGLTRSASTQAIAIDVSSLGLAAGQKLVDRISGNAVTVGPGPKVIITIPGRSAAILAP